MFVNRLKLDNFRNLQSLDLSFSQGFIVLFGDNGEGKTNLLESIYFGGVLGRFPESKINHLFGQGKRYFKAVLETTGKEKNERFVYYEKTETSYKSTLKINNQKTTRKKYQENIPIVGFLPQDLSLLTGSPSRRRVYVDETLSAVSADYQYHLSRYNKTLRQRNDLLVQIRDGKASLGELEVWDEKIAEHGAFLTERRMHFLNYLKKELPSTMEELSTELKEVELVYRESGFHDSLGYLEKLQGSRQKELVLATTIVGPHRDDFAALINNESVVGMISRGQLRALTLGLKVLEKEYIEQQQNTSPIMLLDDVASEFDGHHQHSLIKFLSSFEQVFITTTHINEVENYLPEEAQLFTVKEGTVSPKN